MTQSDDEKKDLDGALSGIMTGSGSILDGVAVLARHLWNLKMRLMVKIGIMPLFRAAWWLFLIEGFVLLAVAMPIGVLFTIMGWCAGSMDPRAEDDFIVPLRRTEPY